METIKLRLPSEEEIEFQIALVDEPAIESDFQYFNKQYTFKEDERGELWGYFMIAEMEIPRFDQQRGAYNVVFDKPAIDAIVRNWSKNGINKNMNEAHQTGELLEGVYVLQHWQIDSKMGINAPNGFKTEADGSWFGVVKCENEDIKAKIKSGELNGFSIEARFIEEAFKAMEKDLLAQLDEILKLTPKK